MPFVSVSVGGDPRRIRQVSSTLGEQFPRAVVCILVPRKGSSGECCLLVQRRVGNSAERTFAYAGVWELPQGKLREGEAILQAADRELFEETGMRVSGVLSRHERTQVTVNRSQVEAIIPVACAVDLTWGFVGVGIVVAAQGEPSDTHYATDHAWMTEVELRGLIASGELFPLNVPLIEEFFDNGWDER